MCPYDPGWFWAVMCPKGSDRCQPVFDLTLWLIQQRGLCPLGVRRESLAAQTLTDMTGFVLVLFRGGFYTQNLWKVVIRIQSSGVKQNWSVGFSKAGALLAWPLEDKCRIQSNAGCCWDSLCCGITGCEEQASVCFWGKVETRIFQSSWLFCKCLFLIPKQTCFQSVSISEGGF